MWSNDDKSMKNKKLAALFVCCSLAAAMLTSLTSSAREFLQSGKAMPIIEMSNEFFRLGNIKRQENDFEGAINAYQDALRLYPGKTKQIYTNIFKKHILIYPVN